jgi:transposase
MYRDVAQWVSICHRVLIEGVSRRQIARETGIDTKTIKKILAHPYPPRGKQRRRSHRKLDPHISTIRRLIEENATLPPSARLSVRAIYEHIRDNEAFCGGYSTVRDFIRPIPQQKVCIWEHAYDLLLCLPRQQAIDFLFALSRANPPVVTEARATAIIRAAGPITRSEPQTNRWAQAKKAAHDWMHDVLQGAISVEEIRRSVGDFSDLDQLIARIRDGRRSERNKALAVLAHRRGISSRTACDFLGISFKTGLKYVQVYKESGIEALFSRKGPSTRKFDNEEVKANVFAVLHQPPANYGINRTTWRMEDLSRVLRETGQPACREVIREITKAAGYRWRKARVVLTSHDPTYTEKVARIHAILSNLGADEAFFSIDEFGPFAVKMTGGRALTAPGEQRLVPQWQRAKGRLILTAALELAGNQVTHFYSEHKNTAEMVRMMGLLVEIYGDRRKLYLSWDAASWHMSKRLEERIAQHNAAVALNGGPVVETAPLPAGAQFLNVIESVFSGMARSIIHNSDYPGVEDAKAAIDRYFAERNARFREYPRRAGKKIWGKEREHPAFSASNNCRDPRYMYNSI